MSVFLRLTYILYVDKNQNYLKLFKLILNKQLRYYISKNNLI
jgi:hypothetical protein